MAQRFLAPEVVFEGLVKQKGTVSHDEHLVTRGYLHGNVLNGIHPDSANYIEVVADSGVNKLKVKPLTIVSTTVDTQNTNISDFVSNVYTGGNFQQSDTVILQAASPVEAWVHNGGANGDENDWSQLNTGLTDSQIRSLLSAGNALTYNTSTGQFDVVQADIQAMFSAGTGLQYSAGQFALNANSDQVSEGSTNLYYKDSLVDAHLSGGTGIGYLNGVISFNGSTDDVVEGTAKYYADSLVDAHLSGGVGIQYSNGQISLNASSDNLTEGTTNLFFQDQRVWDSLGVANVVGPDKQMIQFDSGLGVFNLQLSSIFAEFSAGVGLSFSGGEFSLNASSDDLSEGTTNLFFESQRVYDAIGVGGDLDELIAYDNSKGEFSLRLNKLRKSFQNQSLTANTALTLTHNLGEKLVHVSAMDGQSEAIDLKVVYISTTQLAVTSTVNLTGIDIAISL